ncbi:coiled-coil domain-containing protein 136 isoform X2 [Apteryx mantelli]|uniref:Coiled-coil domain-containing protein 136 isoform X2 n=1 Tax=Apteryx mantelli TaxID=2696672 RepID=A0ABM4E022_9AVES
MERAAPPRDERADPVATSALEEEEDEDEDEDEEELEDVREQVLQLLEELEEARELAGRHEDDSLELQGLLEDERLASARQAELFTRHVQRLQAQMLTLQDEFSCLQESKAAELARVERALAGAQAELAARRREAEEAAALHAAEVAALQEQLGQLRAELRRGQEMRAEYELEATTLRAEIRMKAEQQQGAASEVAELQAELSRLREQYEELSEEHRTLQDSNQVLLGHLHGIELQKYRSRSRTDAQQQAEEAPCPHDHSPSHARAHPGSTVSFWSPAGTGGVDEPAPAPGDAAAAEATLYAQLRSREETARAAQRKCAAAQAELARLQRLYQECREEQRALRAELGLCHQEIARLGGTAPPRPRRC